MDIQEAVRVALKRDTGFFRMDFGGDTMEVGARPLCKPDWVFPRDRIPADDESLEYLEAYHFLEHLSADDVVSFLKEVERVLEPDGIFQYAVPLAGTELAFHDLDHKTFWTESTMQIALNNPYYDGVAHGLWLEVKAQCIIGVVSRNLMVFGQLKKL